MQRQYYCLSPTTLACFANCCFCMKLVLRAAFVSSGSLMLRRLKHGDFTCLNWCHRRRSQRKTHPFESVWREHHISQTIIPHSVILSPTHDRRNGTTEYDHADIILVNFSSNKWTLPRNDFFSKLALQTMWRRPWQHNASGDVMTSFRRLQPTTASEIYVSSPVIYRSVVRRRIQHEPSTSQGW